MMEDFVALRFGLLWIWILEDFDSERLGFGEIWILVNLDFGRSRFCEFGILRDCYSGGAAQPPPLIVCVVSRVPKEFC